MFCDGLWYVLCSWWYKPPYVQLGGRHFVRLDYSKRASRRVHVSESSYEFDATALSFYASLFYIKM